MGTSAVGEALRGNVFVISGAGISVASGLSTFRGAGGLYEGRNAQELASPEGFRNDPALVWNWYLMRMRQVQAAKPNPAHLALAELESVAKSVVIITTNVDLLHEQAGSTKVFKLHGNIMQTLCTKCRAVQPASLETYPETFTAESLPTCACGGLLRPNVVWFGEMPWLEAVNAVQKYMPEADVVLEVGTSRTVNYGFSTLAAGVGIPVVRINPDPVRENGVFCLKERAETALPRLVGQAMSETD